MAIIFARGLMKFAFLAVNIIASVVAVESYPQIAGYVCTSHPHFPPYTTSCYSS